MLRGGTLAIAGLVAFLGVLYLRFSGDALPQPKPTAAPVPVQVGFARICERYSRVPKPQQCGPSIDGPVSRPVPLTVQANDPDLGDGVEVNPLKIGAVAELPPSLALLVETVCSTCDGVSSGLARMYVDSSGTSHVDQLFPFSGLDLGVQQPTVQGIAAAHDGSEIFVSVCCRLNRALQAHHTVIFASRDGGVTWEERGEAHQNSVVLGVVSPGRVLITSGGHPEEPLRYVIFPDGETVAGPPSGPPGVSVPQYAPSVLADGTIAWPDQQGHVRRSDGTDIAVVPFGVGPLSIGWVSQQPFEPGLVAFAWSSDLPGTTHLLTIVSKEGLTLETFSTPRTILGGVWMADGLLAVSVLTDKGQISREVAEPLRG